MKQQKRMHAEEMDWVECTERGYIREGYKGKKEKKMGDRKMGNGVDTN